MQTAPAVVYEPFGRETWRDPFPLYRRLGFVDSHEGMKLHLEPGARDEPADRSRPG